MITFVFNSLESFGFHHPLHPVVVHLPMGMIMGMLLFGLFSYFFKKPEFGKTAHYCAILAFIGLFPAALFGYMDWQYSYNGQWLYPIKIKLALAPVIFILVGAAIKIGMDEEKISILRLSLYVLCMAAATGMGFFGGTLIFG